MIISDSEKVPLEKCPALVLNADFRDCDLVLLDPSLVNSVCSILGRALDNFPFSAAYR